MADKSILIVDDSEINRGVLGEIFKENYGVIEAENGRKALEVIAANKDRISAILLLLCLKWMDTDFWMSFPGTRFLPGYQF